MLLQGPIDSSRLDVKQRIVDDADKIKSWKSPDITESSQLKALRLPDSTAASKVGDKEFQLLHAIDVSFFISFKGTRFC